MNFAIIVSIQLFEETLLAQLMFHHVVTETLEDLLDSLWERCNHSLASTLWHSLILAVVRVNTASECDNLA